MVCNASCPVSEILELCSRQNRVTGVSTLDWPTDLILDSANQGRSHRAEHATYHVPCSILCGCLCHIELRLFWHSLPSLQRDSTERHSIYSE